MASIVVAVAAHRPYRMPADPCYLPVQVGAALRLIWGTVRAMLSGEGAA